MILKNVLKNVIPLLLSGRRLREQSDRRISKSALEEQRLTQPDRQTRQGLTFNFC